MNDTYKGTVKFQKRVKIETLFEFLFPGNILDRPSTGLTQIQFHGCYYKVYICTKKDQFVNELPGALVTIEEELYM